MKLYFENSRGERRIIAEPNTRDGALKAIHAFCEERSFSIYYIRNWRVSDGADAGADVFDVGSHSEFFYLFED